MSKLEKREWWISYAEGCTICTVFTQCPTHIDSVWTNVIEKSAFDSVVKERDELHGLLKVCVCCRRDLDTDAGKAFPSTHALEYIKSERDALAAQLAEMTAKYNFMLDSAQQNAKERDKLAHDISYWQNGHDKICDAVANENVGLAAQLAEAKKDCEEMSTALIITKSNNQRLERALAYAKKKLKGIYEEDFPVKEIERLEHGE